MRIPSLALLSLSLLASTPLLAANWPDAARKQFVDECVRSADANTPPAKARAYCECSAERVSSEFSDAEIRQLQGQANLDDRTRERLGQAASQCLHHLNP
ncbi:MULTISPECIES: hypothetical protein [Pseudomonas]|uniref:Uncharacterized protein n=1 Tax=Pseudomonas flexibilis TaxID=706570 RepID=A0A0B3BVX1_9PSED|nr:MULTISPECIES: hypothetical protein [Pseudomonas]KHL69038.1 hypothetical protein SF06_20820 [Pseudomonas flexibilis]KHO64839.1 hypothetical protein PT85_11730 [Pseudomonas flexibilis]SCX96590.1 hypothetical protein SAMN02927929_00945 [Pseudomonas flexibilis]SIR00174.1 hypothetical protein SAMN05421672_1134 [Pseudomonas flexibilis]